VLDRLDGTPTAVPRRPEADSDLRRVAGKSEGSSSSPLAVSHYYVAGRSPGVQQRSGLVSAGRATRAASAAVLAVEVIGCLLLWAPIPAAWMWIGARVYGATGSLIADLGVAFGGFLATTLLTMGALNRIDRAWVDLRRRAGHEQADGALTQIVVVSATLAMIVFWIWFHLLENAFVIPFMPMR
jgi:hypothetical protein